MKPLQKTSPAARPALKPETVHAAHTVDKCRKKSNQMPSSWWAENEVVLVRYSPIELLRGIGTDGIFLKCGDQIEDVCPETDKRKAKDLEWSNYDGDESSRPQHVDEQAITSDIFIHKLILVLVFIQFSFHKFSSGF